MFIKKDLRKIPEILADAEDAKKTAASGCASSTNLSSSSSLQTLSLSKRTSEFRGGSIKVLCQPSHQRALSFLKHLSLYDSGITSLDGIELLNDSLETLNVAHNKTLTTLPDSMSQLQHKLTTLCMDDCGLEGSLPECILQLKQLKEVRFSNNRLTQLSETLGDALPNLEILCVDGNQLTDLPSASLSRSCSKLRILQARQNNISILNPFPVSASLQLLHLSSNQLTEIDVKALMQCENLTHIYLNSNALTDFWIPNETNTTKLWPFLKRLNLSNNQISLLSKRFLERFGRPDSETGDCRVSGQDDKSAVVAILRDNPVLTMDFSSMTAALSDDEMQVDDEKEQQQPAAIPVV